MLNGAPTPVKTMTVATGYKIAPEGTCRQKRATISHFWLPVNFALNGFEFDTTIWPASDAHSIS